VIKKNLGLLKITDGLSASLRTQDTYLDRSTEAVFSNNILKLEER
jgi:hypothetical protein